MSFGTNPFALGGWSNLQNPLSMNENPESKFYGNMPVPLLQNSQAPLPAPPSGTRPAFIQFRFLHPSPQTPTNIPVDVLHCTVVDTQMRVCYSVATSDAQGPASHQVVPSITHISNSRGMAVGAVEWRLHPFVQMTFNVNPVPKQLASTFLQARSSSTRALTLNGRSYQWVRNPGEGAMYFYNTSYNPPELLGILSREYTGGLLLNISPLAVQAGLLDLAVFASILLLSGRDLD